MALPASDTFPGLLSDPLSGNWTAPDFSISSGNAAINGSATHSNAVWTGDSFPADQYAQCNVSIGPSQAGGPMVRWSSTGGGQAYILQAYGGSVYLQKFLSNYAIFDTIAVVSSFTDGDLLRIEAEGTTLRSYVNGVLVSTDSDSSISTGAAGMHCYLPSSLDNFLADAIGGGGGGGSSVPLLLLLGVG